MADGQSRSRIGGWLEPLLSYIKIVIVALLLTLLIIVVFIALLYKQLFRGIIPLDYSYSPISENIYIGIVGLYLHSVGHFTRNISKHCYVADDWINYAWLSDSHCSDSNGQNHRFSEITPQMKYATGMSTWNTTDTLFEKWCIMVTLARLYKRIYWNVPISVMAFSINFTLKSRTSDIRPRTRIRRNIIRASFTDRNEWNQYWNYGLNS